jgi:23S rRNA (guanosine2251-2'-O)-methyltransferase
VSGPDSEVLRQKAKRAGIRITELYPDKFEKEIRQKNVVHQGVVAKVSLNSFVQSYRDFSDNLEVKEGMSLLVLGEVEDPQNVGAAIRSAAAFGVSAVLIPEHHQAPVNGTVAKVSAGMVFKIPIVRVGNINTALEDLKKKGFWIYGLAGDGEQTLQDEKFTEPSVFVLGNEAKGLREKTKEHCDILLSIPIDSKCESLNAAASAAVVMYAWKSQQK